MAQQTINLYISRPEDAKPISLAAAVENFVNGLGNVLPEKTYAVLYAPHKCHLAILQGQEFHDANGKIETASVFEARVFNDKAELRWLNKENGEGAAVVLCKADSQDFFGSKPIPFRTQVNGDEKELVGEIEQAYLLWGESVGASGNNGWAIFAEARIGSFFVPVSDKNISNENKVRACFKAVEYLGEYEDGNIAVAEERLTGIGVV